MHDNTHADLLDLAVLQNEIHRRAADAGLTCSFVDGLSAPHYDWAKKVIHVPRMRLPASTQDVDYLRGSIIHEIGHSNRIDTLKRVEQAEIKQDKPFGRILNIVEDGAMERGIADTWYGDAMSLGTGHDIHVRKQLEQIADLKAKGSEVKFDGDDVKTNAVYLLGERHRNWDRWSAGTRERLLHEVPKEAVELADSLDAKGWGHKMAKARSTEDVFNVAKALYKELFPEDDKDPESKESDQNGQGEAKGKPGESKGEKDKEKGKPLPPGEKHTTPWQMLTSDHANDGTPDPNAKVDYKDHHYRRPTGPDGLLLPTKLYNPRSVGGVVPPKAPPMVGQLRILLQSEAKNKFEFGLTSGKLDPRKLAKLALPVVPGSDSWRKVFKKRIPGRKINTAVQIMVDGSGSMGGHKNVIASDAADMLVQAFAGPLRIKTAVHGFDAGHRENRIWKLKEFSENVQPGVVAARSRGVGFAGNADGDAVMWALSNIIKRPEHRKIIIVLSDGMPTDGSFVVDPGSMLKYAIDAARKRGVQVYGIGIEDRSVKEFYGKDCRVIQKADELPKAILDTLKERV